MFKKIYLFIVLICCLTAHLQAQMSKGQAGTFALTNATIETVTDGTKNGTLLIEDGKISAIGESVSIPDGATVIDCEGMTIYPGMIDAGNRVGLSEIGSIEVTQDAAEIGEINPHVQALTAVNPNTPIIPVTRVNGVTTTLATPQGGLFSGTAALINLHGYTPDQMYAGFKGVVLNFPATGRRGRRDQRSEEEIKKDLDKKLKSLNEVWDKVESYDKLDKAYRAGKSEKPKYYPEIEALLPAFRGEMKLLVEVNTASDIESAIKWVQEKKLDVIFTGVSEGWRVADKLAEANIPVITGPVLANPIRNSDRYDRPYANAGLMHKAGVTVAIRSNDNANARNLPFHAGFAATYGLGKEEALKAVTITPARLLGVDKELGSLEVGKRATLFVSTADPFETATTIKHLFIDGWQIPIDSRHIRLYEEFLDRSPGLSK